MSIIPKLAISLNRRDEVPNQELAAEIVSSGDTASVTELVANLSNKNKGIPHDCVKVLYEVGYAEPKLIAGHIAAFLPLLTGKDNRMQWGAMTALGCIAKEKPDEIFAELPSIIEAADRGSVITRDHCVNILITLSAHAKYADSTFPLLIEQLLGCPDNQLAMYAERAMPIIAANNRGRFIDVLSVRLEGIEKPSQRTRVEKVIRKLAQITPDKVPT